MPIEVRKANSEERPALAATLAAAFQDDPVFGWLLPEPRRRAAILPAAFDFFLRRVCMPHEETYTVDGNGGACVWLPPGTWHQGVLDQLMLVPGFFRAFGRYTPRALRGLAALEKGHPQDPHHYLVFVGVEPASQGQGLGSKMMHPVLSRCDAEGMAAYLEASTPRNRALYERHGFAVTEEARVGRGAPPVWRMWRDAA
jgi:ribosomal protein S18 acetylase RimI-like enzyme